MEGDVFKVLLSVKKMESERAYRENRIPLIIATICALLNSDGGELNIEFDDDAILRNQADRILRMIQQRLAIIIGSSVSYDKVRISKNDRKQFVFTVASSQSLCTVHYNLYLLTQSQVIPISPLEPPEGIKAILKREVRNYQFENCDDFVLNRQVPFPESDSIQFKYVTSNIGIALADRMTYVEPYISAFANKNGGRIFYGISEDGVVQGEAMGNKDEAEIIKKVTKTIKRLLWPGGNLERGKHWEIQFAPVKDENQDEVPSLFVIIISVAPLRGGLFTKEPESYHVVHGRAERMSFTEWSRKFFADEQSSAAMDVQRNPVWSKTSIKHRKKFEKLEQILEAELTMATKIGQYSVCLKPEFVIGRGSDGTTVYVGLSDDGIEVAVKSLLLDRCKQLGSNEKEILNSPMVRKEQHIVNYRFYTEEVDSVYAYLVLDLCEENLQEYVLSEERSKELLQSNGQAFVRQILHGLKALHCGNPVILHRDLKPSNIFVNVEGEIVLADFGLSRKLSDEETTHRSDQRGTQGWIAVESLPITEEDGDCLSIEESKVRYKKQSDIQVAGMVIFYILTKGEHPFGPRHLRTSNVIQGKPVNLNKLDDPLAKDLIDWMLKHDLKARPSVEECLHHPYLMSTDEKFHIVTRVGNELEIKTNDIKSVVVKQLNADPSLPKPSWKTKIDAEVMSYVSGRRFYSDDVADLVRLIRNTAEHWRDKTPPSTVQAKVGSPKEYFLNLFPTLPVVLHRIIREDPDWKQREQLKQFF